tara:strand:+ start:460 stop:999 length:540 start_codon:yes stop_codon:yes gene_type:complete
MKAWIPTLIRKCSLILATEAVIAVLLSYYACYWTSFLYHFPIAKVAGLWGSISSILVLYAVNEDAFHAAKIRILGSIIGTITPCVFLYIFGYNVFAFGCSIFFTIVVVSVAGLKDAFRTACISLAVVIVVGSIHQPPLAPWLNASTRLLESVIGVVVTMIVIFCFYPVRKYLNFFNPRV